MFANKLLSQDLPVSHFSPSSLVTRSVIHPRRASYTKYSCEIYRKPQLPSPYLCERPTMTRHPFETIYQSNGFSIFCQCKHFFPKRFAAWMYCMGCAHMYVCVCVCVNGVKRPLPSLFNKSQLRPHYKSYG